MRGNAEQSDAEHEDHEEEKEQEQEQPRQVDDADDDSDVGHPPALLAGLLDLAPGHEARHDRDQRERAAADERDDVTEKRADARHQADHRQAVRLGTRPRVAAKLSLGRSWRGARAHGTEFTGS